MARLSEATGRTVVYNNLGQTMRRPGQWQQHMAQVDATTAKGEAAQFGVWSAFFDTANKADKYECATNTQSLTLGGEEAPIFVIAAILIKRESPGPVFFVQQRVGKDGLVPSL